ncbi:MAG TPA: hypothetical protein VF864_02110, partial [Gemmatimonadales bacterium]
ERSAPLPQLESPPLRPTARYPEERPAKPISEYARHAALQGLDPYGRWRADRPIARFPQKLNGC